MFLGVDAVSLFEVSGPGRGGFLLFDDPFVLFVDFASLPHSDLIHLFVVLFPIAHNFFPLLTDGLSHFLPFLVALGSLFTGPFEEVSHVGVHRFVRRIQIENSNRIFKIFLIFLEAVLISIDGI